VTCFPFTRFNQFTLKYLNPLLFRIQRIDWRKRGFFFGFFLLLVWIFQQHVDKKWRKFIKCKNWWNVNSNLWGKSSVPTRTFKLRIKTFPSFNLNIKTFYQTKSWLFLVYVIHICHPIFKLGYLSSTIFFLFQKYSLIFIQRSVCVWSRKTLILKLSIKQNRIRTDINNNSDLNSFKFWKIHTKSKKKHVTILHKISLPFSNM
jgi:hypothetical protein